MRRSFAALLCFLSLLARASYSRAPAVAPVRVTAGTVLKFHLQTRLNPTGDALDALPKGTVLEVRMLDSIDSAADRDGTEFHGTLAAPLVLGGDVIIRYELLVTGLTDRGKSYDLTASLNPSFLDPAAQQPAADSKSATK